MKSDFKNEKASNEKNSNIKNMFKRSILLRWIFFICIPMIALLEYEKINSEELFYKALLVAFIYNAIVSLVLLKKIGLDSFQKVLIILFDIFVISIFIFVVKGANSDIYLIYFFIIGTCAKDNKLFIPFGAGALSIIGYTASSIFTISIYDGDGGYFKIAIRNIFLFIASFLVIIINKEVKKYDEAHKREFKMARTDKLTGLANRHYFEQKLKDEVEYTASSGNPLNILIFDLDNFKKFNDSYGHIWGDKLLVLFSDIIKQNIRRSDTPVRYGGEEFLILIRDLDEDTAKNVGERIRRQLEKQRIYVGDEEGRRKITVSCGISQYPKHSENIQHAIDLADKSLYNAKRSGKNIVVSYGDIIKNDISSKEV